MIITGDNTQSEIYDILFRESNPLAKSIGSGGFSTVFQLRDLRYVAKVTCVTSEGRFYPSSSPFPSPKNIEVENPDVALDDLIFRVDGSQFRLQNPIRLGMVITERRVLGYIHDQAQNGQTVQKHVVKPVSSYFFARYGDIYHILVEEYINGDQADLHNYDLPQALFSIYAISSVLDYFRRIGVIYRDLKPRNIMQEAGSVTDLGKPRLIDFDIAVISPDKLHHFDEVTRWAFKIQEDYKRRKGCCLGTAAYMAPEQSRNDPFDSNLDLFALGITASEILTGKEFAPNGLSGQEICQTVSNQTYLYRARAISMLHNKDYSAEIIESIEKLLATTPSERTLDPLKDALGNLLCERGYDTDGRLNLSLD